MIADDFIEPVAGRVQKLVIGVKDCAVDREINDGLRDVDGGDLVGFIGGRHQAVGDVAHQHDDLADRAVLGGDRYAGNLGPEGRAIALQLLHLAKEGFGGFEDQINLVRRACACCKRLEDAAIAPDEFPTLVVEEFQKALVHTKDAAVGCEGDSPYASLHCLRIGGSKE
ncbi:hypothetical protein AXG89_30950 (plasmid) [Burkholderia sp. PAMC 26561]|nr:hypothetical protein AXG89_30950 [Burkholderia sp. PAMC 26561]